MWFIFVVCTFVHHKFQHLLLHKLFEIIALIIIALPFKLPIFQSFLPTSENTLLWARHYYRNLFSQSCRQQLEPYCAPLLCWSLSITIFVRQSRFFSANTDFFFEARILLQWKGQYQKLLKANIDLNPKRIHCVFWLVIICFDICVILFLLKHSNNFRAALAPFGL